MAFWQISSCRFHTTIQVGRCIRIWATHPWEMQVSSLNFEIFLIDVWCVLSLVRNNDCSHMMEVVLFHLPSRDKGQIFWYASFLLQFYGPFQMRELSEGLTGLGKKCELLPSLIPLGRWFLKTHAIILLVQNESSSLSY